MLSRNRRNPSVASCLVATLITAAAVFVSIRFDLSQQRHTSPLWGIRTAEAFVSPLRRRGFPSSSSLVEEVRRGSYHHRPKVGASITKTSSTTTSLNMFMGSDGGLFGIGTPELLTILLVGYFVLGPSDLYKIVKEIGKFIQNFRTLGTDLATTLENNMESQLQLQEIRKAQRELTDAFSFRRSINVDAQAEPFAVTPTTSMAAATTTATGGGAAAAAVAMPPRKIRRKIKRRPENTAETTTPTASANTVTRLPDWEMPEISLDGLNENEAARIEREFEQYTSLDWKERDWYTPEAPEEPATVEEPRSLASTTTSTLSPQQKLQQQSRFQQQLSGNWNDQILNNEDKLSPLATVMNKIALLEEEKRIAVQRLDEEFRRRQALDEDYYQEQRRLLEEAARMIQENAILNTGPVSMSSSSSSSSSSNNNNNNNNPKTI